MIRKVCVEIKGNTYNRMLDISTDWRYSATAVGLKRFFDYYCINHEIKKDEGTVCTVFKEKIDKKTKECILEEDYSFSEYTNDILYYNFEDCDITSEDSLYYDFVEYFFEDYMHHCQIEYLLDLKKCEENIKLLNDSIKANTIMKKTFSKFKLNNENLEDIKNEIKDAIAINRKKLIKETYKSGKRLYSNFCNENLIEKPKQEICRLNGYNIDLGKKKKSLGYKWDYNTYVYYDEPEFDYIPFGFNKCINSFFINNNYSCDYLFKVNEALLNISTDMDSSSSGYRIKKRNLFLSNYLVALFSNNNIEIISKERDKDYFETIYLRSECAKILINISSSKNILKALESPCRYARNDTYIDIVDYVVSSIINKVRLDNLIDKLLSDKKEAKHELLVSQLIDINIQIYGMWEEYIMSEKEKNYLMLNTKEVAKKIVSSMEKNKIDSYRNQLVSSLKYRNYDRFCEVLMQLSNYSNVSMEFATNLYSDFDKYKNYAYVFVNNLIIASNGGFKNDNK